VIRRLALLIAGTMAFWALLALVAQAMWGRDSLVQSAVAAGLCLVPAAATFVWAAWAYRQSTDKQFAMVLGATGVRIFVVLVGAFVLYTSVPYFRQDVAPGFLVWVAIFYLFTLALETVLALSGRPAAGPLPAGHTPPPNA
jgi:hypothetical protein